MRYSKALLRGRQTKFKLSVMKRAKTRFTTEEKLKEGLMIQAAIKGSHYQQQEVAKMVGYAPNDVSQWWSKSSPTRIPDVTFVHLAEILAFDPSVYRPWLLDMYKSLDRVFSRSKKTVSGLSILQAALESMTPSERIELMSGLGLSERES